MDKNELDINLNEYLPLRDVVFNTLRKAILSGSLKPGERLMEKQLAEKMGVSRTPVREAIRKLELEGFVVMVPRKGAQVAEITEKDIQDVLEVRGALEALAVKIACEKMKKEDLDHLKEIMKEFNEASEKKDIDKVIEKDVEFHDVIYQATNNEKLIQIINNLREQIHRYRVAYLKSFADYKFIGEEHKQIIRAIENKDQNLAEQIANEHIKNQEKTVINYIKQGSKN
ncbi:MAG TPA: GntR family transcriptional regulator [Defluviitaleaceae bacterium]|mgnify:CR=1 FL=1|jgi:DNA-binding GntR family transcriptional regulator|nr:GntR family transcriptional regulator [Candidatus Epulonipiscium sp.]HOQ17278.1 GntR family transcriptional regulator [Defluviitaleaceae bacterium]HPT75679.1 GntR family transcriptional regulator [Defluviitaleaceae bacterium]HQD50372.1 GntR family transcriptional regulator [Defluviitaleaceae bacterium]